MGKRQIKNEGVQLAGVLVQNESGLVLIVKQKNGNWSLPKGHVEKTREGKFEPPESAAVRELEEETRILGRQLSSLGYLGSAEYGQRKKKEGNGKPMKRMDVFAATVADGTKAQANKHDTVRVKWVLPEELENYLDEVTVAFLRESHPELFIVEGRPVEQVAPPVEGRSLGFSPGRKGR